MSFNIQEFVQKYDAQNQGLSDKMQIYLHFAQLSVIIESELTKHLGAFNQFCLLSISQGASKEKIAEITNLSAAIIEEGIYFLVSHGYLHEDYTLTDLGRQFIFEDSIIKEFKEYPLELMIDTSSGSLIYLTQEFEGQFKEGRAYPAFEQKIKPEAFYLTPEFEEPLKKEALKWVNNLQSQNIQIDPEKSSFSFAYEYQGVCNMPVTVTKDMLEKWIGKQMAQDTNRENRVANVTLLVPVEEVELKIVFPALKLVDKQYLKAIELIGVSDNIYRLENIGPDMLYKLYTTGLIVFRENQILLTQNGRILFNLIEARRNIEKLPKPSLVIESLFGLQLDKNPNFIERRKGNDYGDYYLPYDRLEELCLNLHPGLDLIPEMPILMPRFCADVCVRQALKLDIDRTDLAALLVKNRKKRILWGEGWHCICCGYKQHSISWNQAVVFDEYPVSTRAHYLCPSCGAKVDLELTPGSSGVLFINEDGSVVKHFEGVRN